MDNSGLPHFYLNTAESHIFKGSGGGNPKLPPRDRITHGERLKKEFEQLWNDENEKDKQAVFAISQEGVYVEFRNLRGYDIQFESLESRKDGIRLLNIREKKIDNKIEKYATVYIPKDKRHVFLRKLDLYLTEKTEKGILKMRL